VQEIFRARSSSANLLADDGLAGIPDCVPADGINRLKGIRFAHLISCVSALYAASSSGTGRMLAAHPVEISSSDLDILRRLTCSSNKSVPDMPRIPVPEYSRRGKASRLPRGLL
jgi:hypothetical protein